MLCGTTRSNRHYKSSNCVRVMCSFLSLRQLLIAFRALPSSFLVDKNSVLVKGEVTLDKNEQDIPDGSCLSISLHENLSCKRVDNCSEQPLMRFYVKGLDKLPSDKIPYEATIKPRPKPGSYILSVVLNRGWCSEGSSEWIRDGDLFLNEGQKLEIGAAGSVYKDVSITRYYQGQ